MAIITIAVINYFRSESVAWLGSLPDIIGWISRIGEQPGGLFSRSNMAVPLRGILQCASMKGKNENPVQSFDSASETSRFNPSGFRLAVVWPAEGYHPLLRFPGLPLALPDFPPVHQPGGRNHGIL